MALVTARGTGKTGRWTGPDTGPRRIGNGRPSRRGGAVRAALLLLAVWVTAFPLPLGKAHAGDPDTVLPGSGILYPGGFDPNTVGEVRGRAYGLQRPDTGPVRFRLESGNGTYVVIASPGWFWDDLNVQIPEGTEIRVLGSKSLGRDGRLYIVAQEVEVPGARRSLSLRDDGGHPLWKSADRGGTGRGGGMGGMGSGMGRGMGGHR
ncbi:MAG TPA: hypothetical protein DD658_07255 [Deltaproteobacteria bacterium]|nr:hypothetical protein [Deltaproteobacteria bacterium]